MMFCSNCGARSEGGRFCIHCGAKNQGNETNKTNINKKVLGISVAVIALISIIALVLGISTPEKTAKAYLDDLLVQRSAGKVMSHFDPFSAIKTEYSSLRGMLVTIRVIASLIAISQLR